MRIPWKGYTANGRLYDQNFLLGVPQTATDPACMVPPVALIPTNLRIPEDLKAQAQQLADRDGVGLAAWIRDAMRFRLSWELALRARRSGLAVEDMSPDDITRRLLHALDLWVDEDDEANV